MYILQELSKEVHQTTPLSDLIFNSHFMGSFSERDGYKVVEWTACESTSILSSEFRPTNLVETNAAVDVHQGSIDTFLGTVANFNDTSTLRSVSDMVNEFNRTYHRFERMISFLETVSFEVDAQLLQKISDVLDHFAAVRDRLVDIRQHALQELELGVNLNDQLQSIPEVLTVQRSEGFSIGS